MDNGKKYDLIFDAVGKKKSSHLLKIANQLFSEKYGYWRAFLCKPFDTYLFNGYCFVYGPISKSKIEFGPMIIINQYTGETRFNQ